MVVRTNIMAMNAYRNLRNNNLAMSKSLERLSSGYRINRAADDPSGLVISEKMRAQIRGLEQASANAQDGISLIQTAEGAVNEIHSMLTRLAELATKAANGTIQNEPDRQAIQKEMEDLRDEINRIAKSTNFNGKNLLDGSINGPTTITNVDGAASIGAVTTLDFTGKTAKQLLGNTLTLTGKTYEFVSDAKYATKGSTAIVIGKNANDTEIAAAARGAMTATGFTVGGTGSKMTLTNQTIGIDSQAAAVTQQGGVRLQIGDTNEMFNHMFVSIPSLTSEALGLDKLDFTTQEGAAASLDAIKNAVNKASSTRSRLGSMQNRLEYTISNLDTTAENLSAANSRIRDTDMAKEMMNYTRYSILAQVAQAMLAQANQQSNIVLQLLKGL